MTRFTRDDNAQLAHVIIDGGFVTNGPDIVRHVIHRYETDQIDVVILTHPDEDHIGGLGEVLRELQVEYLLTHRPALHGHPELDAAKAVEDLVKIAKDNNTTVVEPFTGLHHFGEALMIAGPTKPYYELLLDEQAETAKKEADVASLQAARAAWARVERKILDVLPGEIPFGDAGGTNPRNNSSVITDIRFGGDRRLVFTGDAGAPALNAAAEYLEGIGRTDIRPTMFDVSHHGSRHNIDSDTLTRFLGDANQEDTPVRSAIISIAQARAQDPRYPSPRIVNGLIRRGCRVYETAGTNHCHYGDGAPGRSDYSTATPLSPQDDSIDDRE
jgi:beta-lactamase superfamily II metal-dependent hydrolase